MFATGKVAGDAVTGDANGEATGEPITGGSGVAAVSCARGPNNPLRARVSATIGAIPETAPARNVRRPNREESIREGGPICSSDNFGFLRNAKTKRSWRTRPFESRQ